MRSPLLWEVGHEQPARQTADGVQRPACSPTWTNYLSKEGPPTLPGIETLYDSFRLSCQRYALKPCLGKRRVEADGSAGPYEFISFREAEQQALHISSACAALGLKRCDKVGVLGINCPEWMLAMQACNRMAYVCVPLYDTLGETAVEFILGHADVRLVFIEGPRLRRLVKALQQVHKLQAVVYWGSASAADIKAVEATGNKVLSWADAIQLGSSSGSVPADPPKPEDLSTIMYTSGTTGDPKGVMITHASLVSAIAGCNQYLESFNESLGEDDSYLSFLPLAHVFDRLAEEFMLHRGGSVGYWRGEIPKVLDDIVALRPTLFCGVPRVFDRIYAGIFEQLRNRPIKLLVFQLCLRLKSFWMKRGIKHDKAAPIADLIAFNTVKKKLGGRVRLILSGAAPLSKPVQEVLSCAMCAPVLQGYGLTETCAASTIAEPYKWDTIGTVGGPMPGVEIRLEAVPDMGYFPTSEPPAGEVCIRGVQCFTGYYKQPELTRECIDEDGFFHTGDIAVLVNGSTLQIVDRKKNIFKLAQGEYVAVEKIENVLKRCPLVEQIWVYGNSFESCLLAVVVPNKKALMEWAAAKGLHDKFEEVCAHPVTKQYILDELTAVGKAGKLRGFELVKAIHTEPEQFTVENDCLTPTFKLKRAQLQKRYQSEVDALYATLSGSSRLSSQAPSAAVSRTVSAVPQAPSSRGTSKGGAVEMPRVVVAKAL